MNNLDEEMAYSGYESLDMIEFTMDKFLDTGSIDMVYGDPVEHGDTLIIPCSESFTVMGFGGGTGYGRGNGDQPEQDQPANVNVGGGGGGGGGGRTFARPVAVIVASPEGVRVEPVVDITKIALAALTAAGFMAGMVLRMSKPRRMRDVLRSE